MHHLVSENSMWLKLKQGSLFCCIKKALFLFFRHRLLPLMKAISHVLSLGESHSRLDSMETGAPYTHSYSSSCNLPEVTIFQLHLIYFSCFDGKYQLQDDKLSGYKDRRVYFWMEQVQNLQVATKYVILCSRQNSQMSLCIHVEIYIWCC